MRGRSVFLGSLLALPIIVGVVTLTISLMHPALKPVMAKLFIGSLVTSGAGQALFFGRVGTAIVILVCGVILLSLIY